MKRCPQLQPLSRDHQAALSLAQQAKRAAASDGVTMETCANQVRQRYAAELARHFAVEEKVLLPALEAMGERRGPDRTLEEHARLKALVDALAQPKAADLAAFGELLSAHVRFEERELFPRAEELLDSIALARVAVACSKG